MKWDFIQIRLLTVVVVRSGCHRECYSSVASTFCRTLSKMITWKTMPSAKWIEIPILIHKMDKKQMKSLLWNSAVWRNCWSLGCYDERKHVKHRPYRGGFSLQQEFRTCKQTSWQEKQVLGEWREWGEGLELTLGSKVGKSGDSSVHKRWTKLAKKAKFSGSHRGRERHWAQIIEYFASGWDIRFILL